MTTVYDFSAHTLTGKPRKMSDFKGNVLLVVNTASKCGFTPQYAGLEALYRKYRDKGLVVLGFPSNQFGEQEPGPESEIAEFCEVNYGVTFPMFSKVVTKAGANQSPIYEFLGKGGQLPQWNFSKYVVGKDGQVVAFFPSSVSPDAKPLRDAITKALAAN